MEKAGDYSHSIIPGLGGSMDFYKDMAAQGVSPKQPMKFAGALGARLLTDMGEDATRTAYWRVNHPMAALDVVSDQVLGDRLQKAMPNPTMRAATTLAAVGAPTAASLGVYDITNIGELGRPKGFAQSYPEVGAEDRRETNQPGLETFDRFLLGRRGRPLKYSTAKEEIPDLTPERYGNYMRHKYQDRGALGLGLLKGTTENLEGVPEVSFVGFPVGLQAAGAATGGLAGLNRGLNRINTVPGASRLGVAARGIAGAALGMGAGKAANMAIAQAQRPDPASTAEYAQMKGQRHLPTQGLY